VGSVIFFAISHLGLGDLECFPEVGGDGEGVLLLEWPIDLDLLAIHSQALLLAPNYCSLKNHFFNMVGNSFSIWCSGSNWG